MRKALTARMADRISAPAMIAIRMPADRAGEEAEMGRQHSTHSSLLMPLLALALAYLFVSLPLSLYLPRRTCRRSTSARASGRRIPSHWVAWQGRIGGHRAGGGGSRRRARVCRRDRGVRSGG